MPYEFIRNRNGLAWLLLILALALHVVDEAATGFLPFYNDLVLTLRERWVFFPLPVFTFEAWLAGLILGLGLGLSLTPIVADGGRSLRMLALVFGVLMIGNGLGHLLGSVYFGRWLPGASSAPLVLAASVFLVWQALRGRWEQP